LSPALVRPGALSSNFTFSGAGPLLNANASSIQKLTAEKDTVQWQLDPVKGELERAAQTATEASARMTELEKKASAFDADTAKLQTALDEATA
jgi:hypothetical protein